MPGPYRHRGTEIVVRAARTQDLPKIIELNRYVQDIHFAAEPTVFRPRDELPGIEDLHLGFMEDMDRYTFVAELGNEVAGYVSLELQRRSAHPFAYARDRLYVHQVSVHPENRRRGVGRALMLQVDALAKESGVSEVALDTWLFNADAKNFFESLGYSIYNLRLRKGGT